MIEPVSLTQVEIFEGLSPEQLEGIAEVSHQQEFDQGDVIFRENTLGDRMYVVLGGEIEIQVDPRILGEQVPEGSEPVPIAVIRRGQVFGEVALVDQGVRSASAVCRRGPAQLLVIPREELLQLCQDDLGMGYRVMFNIAADLAGRIRTTDFLLRGRLLLAPREP
jgi:CRP-like cAMP-binding protein